MRKHLVLVHTVSNHEEMGLEDEEMGVGDFGNENSESLDLFFGVDGTLVSVSGDIDFDNL